MNSLICDTLRIGLEGKSKRQSLKLTETAKADKSGDVDFMTFDTQRMEFEIVPPAKAKLLRESFIQKFLDTSSDYYRKHIASMSQYADDRAPRRRVQVA